MKLIIPGLPQPIPTMSHPSRNLEETQDGPGDFTIESAHDALKRLLVGELPALPGETLQTEGGAVSYHTMYRCDKTGNRSEIENDSHEPRLQKAHAA
ncbi:MAG: hypothetical protein KAU31_01215 [Spirochaetaceae bacterium]|nr:hypothetical protein [Spirochaetaceae bacterium]